jgi:16S rRNA (guanine527-N7)-methyltransferase
MDIGSPQWKQLIADGAKRMGIEVAPEKIDLFAIHGAELIRWNQKTNLTAITEPKGVAVKHFLDSIAPVRMIPAGASVLDIGSGGGFPGIPLKILNPSLAVILIDAVRKKVSFLKHVIRLLGLAGIDACHLRAEEFHQKPQFDVVVSRALFSLEVLISQALPLLKEGGLIIALKGRSSKVRKEWAQWRSAKNRNLSETADFPIEVEVKKYTLPFDEVERTLLIIKRPVEKFS